MLRKLLVSEDALDAQRLPPVSVSFEVNSPKPSPLTSNSLPRSSIQGLKMQSWNALEAKSMESPNNV